MLDMTTKPSKFCTIIAFAIILAAAVIATACAISANKKYRSTWTNIEIQITVECSDARYYIDEYIRSEEERYYNKLIMCAAALRELLFLQYDTGRISMYRFAQMNACVQNILGCREESKLYLDILSDAFNCYVEGQFSTFELRLTTFNNCVSAERQND